MYTFHYPNNVDQISINAYPEDELYSLIVGMLTSSIPMADGPLNKYRLSWTGSTNSVYMFKITYIDKFESKRKNLL